MHRRPIFAFLPIFQASGLGREQLGALLFAPVADRGAQRLAPCGVIARHLIETNSTD